MMYNQQIPILFKERERLQAMMSHLQMTRKHQEEAKRCSPAVPHGPPPPGSTANHPNSSGPGGPSRDGSLERHRKEGDARSPDHVANGLVGPPMPPVSLHHDLAAAAAGSGKPPLGGLPPGLPKPPLGFGPPLPNPMGFPPGMGMPGFPGHRLPGLRWAIFSRFFEFIFLIHKKVNKNIYLPTSKYYIKQYKFHNFTFHL